MTSRFIHTSLKTTLALCVCTQFSACIAEDAAVPAKLSLTEAISTALSTNPNLKQAEINRLDSESRLRIAGFKTNYYIGGLTNLERTPDDTGISTLMRSNITYENFKGSSATINLAPLGIGSNRGSVGIAFNQPLLKGRGALSKKANTLLDAQNALSVENKQFYLTRQSKVLEVVNNYFRAVRTRELVKVQEEALKIAETEAYGAKRRAEEGLIRGIDVARAEISVSDAKEQLNQATQSARSALDRLMLSMGGGVGQTPELTDDVPAATDEIPGFSQALDKALANRTEISVYDERIANQQRKLNLANDQFRPELNLVAGFNSTSDSEGFLTSSLYDRGSFNTGFELRIPMDKRINIEDKATAERAADILGKLKDYQLEEIAEQVRNAIREAESARTSLGIYEKSVKLAEDSLNLAQRMVDEGLRDNRDLLDAQSSLTRAKTGLLSAKIDTYLAGVNLKYAIGEDLTTMGSK